MDGYYDRPLAGVGGWLTFFLIGIGIVAPIMLIVSIAGIYSDPNIAGVFADSWVMIQLFEWSLAALNLALLWYLVWRLLKVQVWQTVQIVIAGIWTSAIGIALVDSVGIVLITGISLGDVLANVVPQLVRGAIYCAVWTAYFLRSERVANTYLRTNDAEEMAEVFN